MIKYLVIMQLLIGVASIADAQTPVKDLPQSDTTVAKKVEEPAEFPGGSEALIKFLTKNLNSEVPVKQKAPRGRYRVEVRFIIDKEGAISSIQAITQFGYGMEDEVIRVIKRMPKWKPGKQNGQFVKSYFTQPLIFHVD